MEVSQAINKHVDSEAIAWSVAYAVEAVIITVINTVTLYIFIKTTSLRTRKHVMIINLAVADLLFGAAGMPAYVFYFLKPSSISFSVQQTLNSIFKKASLFTLAVIAVERMHAIIWPIRHKVMSNRLYKIAIVLIWVLAAVTATVMTICASELLANVTMLLNIIFPVEITAITFIIVACYVSIWISVRRRERRKLGTAATQDKALAVTLLLVAGVFLVGWAIPMYYFYISRMCKKCYQPTRLIYRCLRLIFGVQAMVNPVIYCFRLPAFQASLKAKVEEMKCSEDFRGTRLRIRQRTKSSELEMVNASIIKVNE